MKKLMILILVLLSLPVYSASWKKLSVTPPTSSTGTAGTALTSAQCPTNYIFVPSLAPYTVTSFCVAKYEMKNDGYGTPVSVATSTPWVSIDRNAARAKCQSLGGSYDLISNNHWQTIARNIAGVASNWDSGIVATGQVNWGHTDGAPSSALAAVTSDNDPCNGTGETCSSSVWNAQRRTHILSNGNVIWDFGGNVYEWVTNDQSVAYSTNYFVSSMTSGDNEQIRYGAETSTICPARWSTPYCGFGSARIGFNAGGSARGGYWAMGEQAGIFTTTMEAAPSFSDVIAGFRCVFAH